MSETLLAPLISAAILGGLALLGVLWQVRNVYRGARESRMPTLEDAWIAADDARHIKQEIEDWAYRIRSAARAVINRARAGGFEPTPDELAQLEEPPPTTTRREKAS